MNRCLFNLVIAVCLVAGCTSPDPTKVLVAAYLSENLGSDIKVFELSETAAWQAADSTAVLKQRFETEKTAYLDRLNSAIELSKKAIEEAEESKKGGFSILDEIADQTIAQSNSTIDQAEALIEAINGDCKGTVLEDLYNQIESYNTDPDAVLFHLINGKYKNGGEEAEFNLRLSPDLTHVLGPA
jgi:ribosomal silencing factor RsfS